MTLPISFYTLHLDLLVHKREYIYLYHLISSTAPLRHVTSAQTTQVPKLNRGTTARSTFHSGQTRERKKMAEERSREAGSPVASGRTSFISKLTSRFSKRYIWSFSVFVHVPSHIKTSSYFICNKLNNSSVLIPFNELPNEIASKVSIIHISSLVI